MIKSQIEKILVITLNNIGDVILTTPVIETLKENFSPASLDVLVGPRGKEVLEEDKGIRKLIVYDKHVSLKEKINLIRNLRQEGYDLVVDLRHTLIPLLIHPRYRTPLLRKVPKGIFHMRDRHLSKIETLRLPFTPLESFQFLTGFTVYRLPLIHIDEDDERYVNELLQKEGLVQNDFLVVISPGARSSTKRWPIDNFIEVAKQLRDGLGVKIILVGDKEDYVLCEEIKKDVGEAVYNFSNRTTIPQLKFLLEKTKVLITNDSAVLHCGSAANIPTIAIFGPSDPLKYGPLAEKSVVLRRLLPCVPCEEAQCRYGHWKCLELVKPWEVTQAVKNILFVNREPCSVYRKDAKRLAVNGKRILIIRTDRIGDVVLSTPVIKNLRDNLPQSFIAMMVRPYTKDIVEGNPYLDEVIVYDKDMKQKFFFATLRFAFDLRRYRFDSAIILHPTNRAHIILFLAGIPKRVGYNKKIGFLNTDRIAEKKCLGEKHELEYNLDLLRLLGIEPRDKTLFVPIRKEAEEKVNLFLSQHGTKNNNLIVIHPGASCPSKVWPSKNFARVADNLIKNYQTRILIVTDEKEKSLGEKVAGNMEYKPILALGKFSLSELAGVLKRARLFISNDSGPVHIAVAVGTPVISIFGRKQPGLSPKRWGPVGKNDIVLHRDVGCSNCLAHNCKIGFKCLKAITPEEVLEAVERIGVLNSNIKNQISK